MSRPHLTPHKTCRDGSRADRLSRDLKKRHGLIRRAHSLACKGKPVAGRDERVGRTIEFYRPAVRGEHEHVLGRCTRRAIVCCNLSTRLLVLQQGADHRAAHHNEQRHRECNANEHRNDYECAARSARLRRCFCSNRIPGRLSTKPLSLPGVGSGVLLTNLLFCNLFLSIQIFHLYTL